MILYLIPARGGSKGLPGKNIKPLHGKPLIHYSIETARLLTNDENICISTDSEEIREIAKLTGLEVPFLRPAELATDTAGSYEVMLHALEYFESKGKKFEHLMLLQPTSPFRNAEDLLRMQALMQENRDTELVVSVGVSHHNPYFSLFEEDKCGWLVKSKTGFFDTRQDCPPVYYYNGSAYLVRVDALKQKKFNEMRHVRKYIMEEKYCQDIDTKLDWLICEALIEKGVYKDANS